ncbi:NADPH2:quinone reductase [Natronocella acetinitrilica]|uniref:NADPH:quinone reductase n=1 Tax=Natronocella acetinitrilica TaxID=414046 RepID=A0AAE3KEQ0_9GAMM|nr:quinone oxidoreductase [Natronocella acetinitrilica]MCP1673327.1 NADPH2:quinone reductase [Natronocella acetinitrilica]
MSHAIMIHETGAAECMRWEAVQVGSPGQGEVRIRHTAIGLNYIDVYFRTGQYKAPQMPFTPGMEAAGIVEELGAGVTDLKVGDRVAYATPPPGSYCEERVMSADRLVRVPDGISDDTAAAMMLKGMTVWYLLHRSYAVKAGDTVLIHAAAGGVGLIACQWANHLGATVIGTVGSDAKAELARTHGCHHAINYNTEDFVERVKEITGGKGVPVVYDSVGKTTFMKSLDCLQLRGTMVNFGQSSGAMEPLDVGILAAKGSLYVQRPTLFHHIATREDLEAGAGSLMDLVGRGIIRIDIGQRFALREAVEAHRSLEARKTTGSTVLVP